MNTCTNMIGEELPTVGESVAITVRDAIAIVGPSFVARYVAHQALVCQQTESDIDNSLRVYVNQLKSNSTGISDRLTVGDLWSGLLWWRDEASWVGKTGVFSFAEVKQLATATLQAYVSMRDSGRSTHEIAQLVSNDTELPPLARRLADGLKCDGAAPGFRAIVSYAACQLGATADE